jgi:hypothetical protein
MIRRPLDAEEARLVVRVALLAVATVALLTALMPLAEQVTALVAAWADCARNPLCR